MVAKVDLTVMLTSKVDSGAEARGEEEVAKRRRMCVLVYRDSSEQGAQWHDNDVQSPDIRLSPKAQTPPPHTDSAPSPRVARGSKPRARRPPLCG